MIESLPNEMWKTISEFPNYQTSSMGRVKSLNYHRSGKEQILKQHKNKNGYLSVPLYKNGKQYRKYIHRIVAIAFIPNPNNLSQINHINENKTDNSVKNLEWVSPKQNVNYGLRNEKVSQTQKNDINKSKQVNQYSLDDTLIKTWQSTHEIERQLGFAHTHISQCCNGKLKTSHGYIWRYV